MAGLKLTYSLSCWVPHTGFIKESKWVFRSKKTGDYREEITDNTFRDWFLNRILNFLEAGSIIIGQRSLSFCDN